ncbi:MAG: hypothetical protein M1592_05560, partial [Candidatus Thermoplasmatota archaeon]|nr:hypothetical protein [Candidatus Thermoplasmatota archaeon]
MMQPGEHRQPLHCNQNPVAGHLANGDLKNISRGTILSLKYIQVCDYVEHQVRARGPVWIWQQPPKLQIRGPNPL